MLTYYQEKKFLFPCDLFGNHIATSETYSVDDKWVYHAAKRYYAEIMMPFRRIIQKYMKRLSTIDIELIAPSHGVIYPKPEFIMHAYNEWVGDDVKNEVVLPFVTMYKSTEIMAKYLTQKLVDEGIKVNLYPLTVTDIGELAMGLVNAATVVIGSPTVLTGPHPIVANALYLANRVKPKVRFATVIGSYGWKGTMVDQIVSLIPNLKVELLSPVVIKGKPTSSDFQNLDKLAKEIASRHKDLGIL
jgi:flavorubredoxin